MSQKSLALKINYKKQLVDTFTKVFQNNSLIVLKISAHELKTYDNVICIYLWHIIHHTINLHYKFLYIGVIIKCNAYKNHLFFLHYFLH